MVAIEDTFFTQVTCDRCECYLDPFRIMSWFTQDCICSECSKLEDKIKKNIIESGKDTKEFENCGYVPNEYLVGARV